MSLRDRWSGLFWLLIAGYICRESAESGIGSFHAPGPGFFPFLTGVVLGALSLVLLVSALFTQAKGKLSDPWKGVGWSKVVLLVVCLVLYCILLPVIGYLIATFGLTALMLGLNKRLKLWVRGVAALVIVLSTYVIFHTLLQVQLPTASF